MSDAVGSQAVTEAAPSRAATPSIPVVEVRQVTKTYTRGANQVEVLRGLDLTIDKAAFIALMGPSGSGKTTLLNLIAGLDRPTSGTVRVAGQDLGSLSESGLSAFRARTLGFVFQTFNLIPVLTAVENVALPLILAKLPAAERTKRAETALRIVGLEDRLHHYPRQLSGGQEQRVAVARAIVNDPTVIVADEPTGDLDRDSADEILGLMSRLHREFGKTIVMVTHDPLAAERAEVTHRLNKGRFA